MWSKKQILSRFENKKIGMFNAKCHRYIMRENLRIRKRMVGVYGLVWVWIQIILDNKYE